jgi:hypothetical protein
MEDRDKNWFQRNEKAIMVVSLALLVAILIMPDVYLRKYVPFVK